MYAVHHTAHCTLLTVERLRFPEENNASSAIAVPQCVVNIILSTGHQGDVIEVFEDRREQIDEYETESDEGESDFKEHSELFNRAFVT